MNDGGCLGFIIACILIIVCIFLLSGGYDDWEKEKNKPIGKYIILEKDTLLITNHNVFRGYQLINGVYVNEELVKKSKLIDKR